MEVKKSEKASLNNKRLLFTEIGFVFALLVTLCAFEWTSKDKAENDWVADEQELIEEEIIPITQETPPPPPEAPKIPILSDEIEIIDDNIKVDNEMISLEDNDDLGVDIKEYVEETQ